jgi:hypothetical protein
MSTEKRYNAVLDVIDKRLIPNEVAKKARGEVFTPLPLVREMLLGLRKSARVDGRMEIWGVDAHGNYIDESETDRIGGIPLALWRDPATKWLDPANGIGNFPVVAFYILDYQLGKHSIDTSYRGDANKRKRRKHIVENMLYMIELNKGNVNTAKKIFEQITPGATPNICCADSLKMTDEKLIDAFGINRFDVVMGNPPFNPGKIWYEFITLYTRKSTSYLAFIVPSTFTSNITGAEVVAFLKENGLLLVKYLTLKDFNNTINLDTLYFVLKKGYTGEILINDTVEIARTSPIINLTNDNDKRIFTKILKYISENGSLTLFKGKNDTLKHDHPVETASIKFNRDAAHPHRMLSRLGGGDHEYFWVNTFKSDDTTHHKLVFPRGTGSYNSVNNLKNTSKDMVYSTCVSPEEILSNGIMYTPLDNLRDCDAVKFYTMRSKIVRYVFLKINHLAELTPTIFSYIPKIPVTEMTTDEKIYDEIGLSDSDAAWIEEILTARPDRARTARAKKPTSTERRTAKAARETEKAARAEARATEKAARAEARATEKAARAEARATEKAAKAAEKTARAKTRKTTARATSLMGGGARRSKYGNRTRKARWFW